MLNILKNKPSISILMLYRYLCLERYQFAKIGFYS